MESSLLRFYMLVTQDLLPDMVQHLTVAPEYTFPQQRLHWGNTGRVIRSSRSRDISLGVGEWERTRPRRWGSGSRGRGPEAGLRSHVPQHKRTRRRWGMPRAEMLWKSCLGTGLHGRKSGGNSRWGYYSVRRTIQCSNLKSLLSLLWKMIWIDFFFKGLTAGRREKKGGKHQAIIFLLPLVICSKIMLCSPPPNTIPIFTRADDTGTSLKFAKKKFFSFYSLLFF